jgi:hypothetical protein
MTDPTQLQVAERQRFRRTLVKVLTMQVAALLLLWWLQATFTR